MKIRKKLDELEKKVVATYSDYIHAQVTQAATPKGFMDKACVDKLEATKTAWTLATNELNSLLTYVRKNPFLLED